MSFTDTSRNIRLVGSTLHAECQLEPPRDSYVQATIPLDTLIGNTDGAFRWGGRNWSKSARGPRYVDGTLYASLQTSKGDWVDSYIDLNEHIANCDGVLEGVDLLLEDGVDVDATHASHSHLSIGTFTSQKSESTTSYYGSISQFHSSQTKWTSGYASYSLSTTTNLTISGGTLSADCPIANGQFQRSTLDLNKYIGNIDGELQWGDNNFTLTSANARIVASDSIYLVADCQLKSSKRTRSSRLDLSTRITCVNGRLVVNGDDRDTTSSPPPSVKQPSVDIPPAHDAPPSKTDQPSKDAPGSAVDTPSPDKPQKDLPVTQPKPVEDKPSKHPVVDQPPPAPIPAIPTPLPDVKLPLPESPVSHPADQPPVKEPSPFGKPLVKLPQDGLPSAESDALKLRRRTCGMRGFVHRIVWLAHYIVGCVMIVLGRSRRA